MEKKYTKDLTKLQAELSLYKKFHQSNGSSHQETNPSNHSSNQDAQIKANSITTATTCSTNSN